MLARLSWSLYLSSCQPPGSPRMHLLPGPGYFHCPGLADSLKDASAYKHGCCKQPSDSADVSHMCPDLLPQPAAKTVPFSTSHLQLCLLSGLSSSSSVAAISDTDDKEETENLQKVESGGPFGAATLSPLPNACEASASMVHSDLCSHVTSAKALRRPSPAPHKLSHYPALFGNP